jgi:hypothetical protein
MWLLHRLTAAVDINSRVCGVHVSLNDFVRDCITLIAEITPIALIDRIALTHRSSDIPAIGWVAPVDPSGRSHVVVVHLAMNAVVAIQVVIVHVVVDNLPVYADVRIIGVDVDAVDADIGSRAADPASLSARPAMVVNTMATPVKIIVQPCPDGKARAKGD